MAKANSNRAGREIEIRQSGLVPYRDALEEMERRNAAIAADGADELVWLLEHPPVYTAGTSANPAELLDPPDIWRWHPPEWNEHAC